MFLVSWPTTSRIRVVLVLLLVSCSAPPLQEEPWARTGAGHSVFGVSTGWAIYEATVSVKGTSSALAPGGVGEIGEDTTDLAPNYGGALKYHYFLTDNLALGGIIELRSFHPDPIMPLSAELEAEDFETMHFLASSRWFFDPMGASRRWRAFVGVDLSYVPDVDLGDVRVTYDNGIPPETIEAVGSEYWSLAPVVGLTYLLFDGMTLDVGGFYEFPLTASEGSVTFENLGGAEADVRVEPEGLIGFFGVSWHF